MSIENIEKKYCTGCLLCGDVCTLEAVSYKRNPEGFLYPIVDSTKCVSCGLCEKMCPVNNKKGQLLGECIDELHDLKVYAVINNDVSMRRKSSSGGVFPLLASYIIKNGGVVYGAAFDDTWCVHHMGVSNICDIEKLQSSKYIQSNMAGVYRNVKEMLKKGKLVMFVGVPCQVSALKNYLGETNENLFCVDLFCHGISSPGLFEEYLNQEVGVNTEEIKQISFRNKDMSWENYRMQILYNRGVYSRHYRKDAFLKPFCRGVSLRNSCYECGLKGFPRQSDITMGDFWTIDRVFPDMNDHKGTSIIFCNTQRGRILLEKIQESAIVRQVKLETVKRMYSNSGKTVKRPEDRDDYFTTAKTQGVQKAMKLYCNIPWKEHFLRTTRKILIKLHLYERIREWKQGAAR